MKVLAAASEIYPLVKTGGLADVVGALPGALLPQGVSVRTLVPAYPAVIKALGSGSVVHRYGNLFGDPATVVAGQAHGLELLALDAPHLFKRPGNPYLGPDGKDWPDNAQRFAALALAAADVAGGAIKDYAPDILHVHDWQAALAPAYLKFGRGGPKSVITIHNIAFQGQFPAALFASLKMPQAAFAIDGIEFYGKVGYLKGGLQCADAITTVSPTYAEEIRTPEFGMGLDGVLRARRDTLFGIVNGIDTEVWNPATDANISATYDSATVAKREVNKREIEKRFGLERDDGMLYCVVSRLTGQKGMDIFAGVLDRMVTSGARLALIGQGEAQIEKDILTAARRHKGRIGMVTAYDEVLSHLLQAGADAILVPSRFEPCGLTQLYGLRYGCVPVVARTGGLADTIIDANEAALAAGAATGIQFSPVDAVSLENAMARAMRLFADRNTWRNLQRRGMRSELSWKRSAAAYAALYQKLHKPS
jgi:starch synthase